jgi:hypothetical protein
MAVDLLALLQPDSGAQLAWEFQCPVSSRNRAKQKE